MSGTSLDGVKAALISTDGVDIFKILFTSEFPYPEHIRAQIRLILGKKINQSQDKILIESVEALVSEWLVQLIENIKAEHLNEIDLIGLEGPTICHDPENKYTYQLGKGREICSQVKIKLVTHFHNADILNGGQGAPITASYYNALAQDIGKPAAFINIGGTTNLTWIGHYGEIIAFDCGPGNALIDDWMLKHGGVAMDFNGRVAASGTADEKIVGQMMKHRFFAKYPPKSLDRSEFDSKAEHLEGLSLFDGAATATAFISEAIAYSLAFYLPEIPAQAIICGGGAKNPTLVRFIRQRLKDMAVATILEEEAGIKINDAAAIAFLAARRLYALPITFPGTTGIAEPMTGGEIYNGESKDI